MRPTRNEALKFLHATLGIWLGIHAFRTFVPTAVWNLSDALPLTTKGAIAVGVHLAGVIGCLLPFTRRARSAVWLAVALALVSVLRQMFLGDDVVGSACSLLGWILWLWWFAALTRSALQAHAQLLAPALAGAFALQVGVQSAFHGLDLPLARGPVAVLCALVIAGLFVATARGAQPDEQPNGGNLGLIAFGAAFFLEITLLSNVGRAGFLSRLALVPSALLIEAGLIAAMLVIAVRMSRALVFVSVVVLVAVVAFAPRLAGNTALVLVLAQCALIALLHAAALRRTASHARTFAGGAILSFILVFLFYNQYEWPLLWIVAALALALCALPHAPLATVSHRYAAVGFAGAALSLIGLSAQHVEQHAATMKVLTYNIHQGFDVAGVPAMQQIADEIRKVDADVIALQEVGRGWTLVGGADLVAYLKYRLPEYQLEYVPINGQLLGVALLTRVPTLLFGPGVVFESAPGDFRYGYAQADVRMGDRTMHFVGVHLTAGLEGHGATGRADQMTQLLRAQQQLHDVVIMGDFNSQPDDPPIRQILSSGYRDAAALVGLANIKTWPATNATERDDYVFLRGAVDAVSGSIPSTTASDHLPLAITLAKPRSR